MCSWGTTTDSPTRHLTNPRTHQPPNLPTHHLNNHYLNNHYLTSLSLKLSTASLHSSSAGSIYNLVASDVQRFDNIMPFLHFWWSSMVVTIIICVLLGRVLHSAIKINSPFRQFVKF